MKKISWIFAGGTLLLAACDLQPRILSLPDTVGEFISARYPALLADPNSQPEIYNSAVTDYGVYAAPDIDVYGTPNTNDYVLYASVDDYIIPPQVDAGAEIVTESKVGDDYLVVPMYGGGTGVDVVKQSDENVTEDLVVRRPTTGAKTVTKVDLQEITVARGDTLYSLSRKYQIPVNDLAVMNRLSAPFTLSVGQKLKVPNLAAAPVAVAKSAPVKDVPVVSGAKKQSAPVVTPVVPVKKETKKISSDPNKKLPTITARSSNKFSWPVRGRLLSAYGAKSNGLFNDGINISATKGTTVKAAENGVVAYAGNEVKGMGNLIIIQHSGGWMTVYAHMDSMTVRRGAKVKVGQKIGTVGTTGKVDSPQLHFEIRKGTKAYNPTSYLK